jgi:hypothetical protein
VLKIPCATSCCSNSASVGQADAGVNHSSNLVRIGTSELANSIRPFHAATSAARLWLVLDRCCRMG